MDFVQHFERMKKCFPGWQYEQRQTSMQEAGIFRELLTRRLTPQEAFVDKTFNSIQ